MFPDTETAQMAHLVLPAAGCGEKDGTFINSERRIGRRAAGSLDPPGEALPDLEIFQRIARAWGCDDPCCATGHPPERVFPILKRLSKGRPCDISGIDGLLHGGAVGRHPVAAWRGVAARRWPGDRRGQERRLFEDGRLLPPRRQGAFHLRGRRPTSPETPDDEYPYVLLTGRGSINQWHTLTRTDRAPLLKRASPDPATVQISPRDAETLGIGDGDLVEVRSRRGSVRVGAVVNSGVVAGQVFMSMHYPLTNQLTLQVFDTYSRQPAFKSAAVDIKKA